MQIQVPQKIEPLFHSKKRYIILAGGRGSAKSWSVALKLVHDAAVKKTRILCAREVQNSIKDSVHRLLSDTIKRLEWESYFDIQKATITSTQQSDFIFKGLWNNEQDVKSTEGVKTCWVEEAQSISRASLDTLTPTIREPESQIIFSYNPTHETDPVHADFVLPYLRGERNDVEYIDVNYWDNPFFPEVLRSEMEWDKKTDYDKYLHKWEGKCVAHSQAQIFHGKWEIKDFEAPEATRFLFGADWGFGQDPTALVRMYVQDQCLYIDHESYGFAVEINDYPRFFDSIQDAKKNKIVADSARPESISYLRQAGFFVVPSKKGPNSIEEGIERLRSFKRIFIHPRCKNTIDEFRFYCYKTDKRTGIISSIPDDKHNHIIDSIRYATEDLITRPSRPSIRSVRI